MRMSSKRVRVGVVVRGDVLDELKGIRREAGASAAGAQPSLAGVVHALMRVGLDARRQRRAAATGPTPNVRLG